MNATHMNREQLLTDFSMPGGNSELVPPDTIPNSEVKRFSADGSTWFPRARVGHCQALITKGPDALSVSGLFQIPLEYMTVFDHFRKLFSFL